MKRIRCSAGLAVVLLLAGCTAAAAPSPEPSTPSPSLPARYTSVVELRDAAVAAGYFCQRWKQDNKVTAAAESGSCSEGDVFSTYLSEDAAQSAAQRLKSMGFEVHLLVGANWVINGDEDDLAMLQKGLGGTLVTGSDE